MRGSLTCRTLTPLSQPQHSMTLPYNALHCTKLNYTALHCTALHCTALHYISQYWSTKLHNATAHCTMVFTNLAL